MVFASAIVAKQSGTSLTRKCRYNLSYDQFIGALLLHAMCISDAGAPGIYKPEKTVVFC